MEIIWFNGSQIIIILESIGGTLFFTNNSWHGTSIHKKINGMKLVEMRIRNLDPAYSAWATWDLNFPFFPQDGLYSFSEKQ